MIWSFSDIPKSTIKDGQVKTVEEKASKRNAKERVSAYTELMREAERTFQQKEQAGVRTDAEGVCKVGAAGKNQQVTANAGTALGLCPLADALASGTARKHRTCAGSMWR